MEKWKTELEAMLAAEDYPALLRVSRDAPARTLRYLTARLYSPDPEIKWRAVNALGALAADHALLSDQKLSEQLRRYFWFLNDESGAVPFGIPEAIGEVISCRPSLQEAFLPLICSMVNEEEVTQTGAIERGVIWAIGRVGVPAVRCNADILPRIRSMAAAHSDPETRQVAQWALRRLEGAGA
jgi:AraC family transcriptional regulator of adaptative response/methylated-DNA-[protein]-cysteine methyltransferase